MIQPGDLIRNKASKKRLGDRAPVWHVSNVLADGTLWAWSNGRGFRQITRPECYEVLPTRIPVSAHSLLGGAGGMA